MFAPIVGRGGPHRHVLGLEGFQEFIDSVLVSDGGNLIQPGCWIHTGLEKGPRRPTPLSFQMFDHVQTRPLGTRSDSRFKMIQVYFHVLPSSAVSSAMIDGALILLGG